MAIDPSHFRLSPHAERRLKERESSLEQVGAVLRNPRCSIYRSDPGRHAEWRYRRVDEAGLVVVTDGRVIVTAFQRDPNRA